MQVPPVRLIAGFQDIIIPAVHVSLIPAAAFRQTHQIAALLRLQVLTDLRIRLVVAEHVPLSAKQDIANPVIHASAQQEYVMEILAARIRAAMLMRVVPVDQVKPVPTALARSIAHRRLAVLGPDGTLMPEVRLAIKPYLTGVEAPWIAIVTYQPVAAGNDFYEKKYFPILLLFHFIDLQRICRYYFYDHLLSCSDGRI